MAKKKLSDNPGLGSKRWAELREMYVTDSKHTYKTIAKEGGISEDHVKARGAKEGWRELRRKHGADINHIEMRARRAAVMRANLASADKNAAVRYRYARTAKKISHEIMEIVTTITEPTEDGPSLATPAGIDMLLKATAIVRRCQEIEFIARGMPAEIAQMEHTATGWNQYLQQIRQERGLPEKPSPFAEPARN